MATVGIIGGTGFIGSYNTKKFLAEGYQVRVSTRDLAQTDRFAHLQALPGAENLEMMEVNVENKTQLGDFLRGCSIVIHGGTPFQLDVTDPQAELFDPTIKGTENFLELAKETAGLERVIFIASVAAMNTDYPMPPAGKGEEEFISEQDAPHHNEESHPYAQAKFFANQTVERFLAENPNPGFDIISVSPVWVTGMALSAREDSTSMGMQFLMKNMIAPNPFIQMLYDSNAYWAMVDVEDVSEAIYQAANGKGQPGKNYVLSCESYRVSDINLMLNGNPPKAAAKVIYENQSAQADLGIAFKSAQASLGSFTG